MEREGIVYALESSCSLKWFILLGLSDLLTIICSCAHPGWIFLIITIERIIIQMIGFQCICSICSRNLSFQFLLCWPWCQTAWFKSRLDTPLCNPITSCKTSWCLIFFSSKLAIKMHPTDSGFVRVNEMINVNC